MRQGEEASVLCPGALDKGKGLAEPTKLTGPGENSDVIPSNADMKYEFEVIECGINPPSLQPSMYNEEMVSGQCFYIVSSGPNNKGSNIALEVSHQEKYYPKVWGIYNIFSAPFEGREHPNPYQQFEYDAKDQSVKSLSHPEAVLFEGFNQNLIVYKQKNMNNQRFKYDSVKKRWYNSFTGRNLDISEFKAGANIFTHDPKDINNQKWELEYCNEDHGHDH